MKRKKQTKKTKVKVTFVPNWKYRMLLARLDKQDKIISDLFYQLDDLSYNFKRFTKLYSI